MLLTGFTKVAVAAVFTVAVAGGAALALNAATTSAPKQAAVEALERARTKAAPGVVVDGVVVANGTTDGAVSSSTSAGASTSGSGTSAGASSGATSSQDGASGGVTTGIVGPTGGGATGGGGSTVGGGATGGSTGTGGTTGGSQTPAPGTGSGGSTGGSGDTLTPPTTPTVPTDVSLYREGSYTVTVPATPATSKKLCLSGEVNRCRTISVPALQAVSMTVSYAANASATPPTFSVFPCAGGLGVTVAGVTPGTSVTARAQGVDVFGVISADEVSQSASLCDA